MGSRSRSSPLGLGALVALAVVGCARAPSPLTPQFGGSIGMPHRGMLTASAELPREGEGYKWLRKDDRHHGLPRFVHAIERAAATVARERPGGTLSIGDLSVRKGGVLMPHFSHRNGRDADLLLYMTTLDGAPVESPGFIGVGSDGLAWDEKGKRFLRFDVERTWILVRTLVLDPDARIQWIFANHNVEAILVEWARARGESGDAIVRAMEVMHEPHPGGAHDDHVHVRTTCSPADVAGGCENFGPRRAWIDAVDRTVEPVDDWELVLSVLSPFGAMHTAASTSATSATDASAANP